MDLRAMLCRYLIEMAQDMVRLPLGLSIYSVTIAKPLQCNALQEHTLFKNNIGNMTNFIVQGPSSEADSHSAGQDISPSFIKLEGFITVFSQDPVVGPYPEPAVQPHILFLQILFNIIIPSMPKSYKRSLFLLDFSNKC
jgi:hypothetical protein